MAYIQTGGAVWGWPLAAWKGLCEMVHTEGGNGNGRRIVGRDAVLAVILTTVFSLVTGGCFYLVTLTSRVAVLEEQFREYGRDRQQDMTFQSEMRAKADHFSDQLNALIQAESDRDGHDGHR
jgi:hypothetical protein